MKVFIVGGPDGQYAALFKSMGHNIIDRLEQAKPDLFCFTGGADVTPAIYGDAPHSYTGCDPYRDMEEEKYFDYAVASNIPMVGICRGGQFLNVMSGGRMYQHVEGHTRSHAITDVETGESIYVSSTHHQMIMPAPDALLVATAALGGAREWYDGQVFKKDVSKEDIEVVFYEKTRCLCFQPHPEFNSPEYAGMKAYFKKLLSRFLQVE